MTIPTGTAPLRFRHAVFAVCITLLGCAGGEEGESEHHGGHDAPPHKPASFAAAIPETARRFEELTTNLSRDDRTRRLAELDDILRWLPELAGDTDLRRADWETAKSLVDQLAALRADQPRDGPFAPTITTKVAPLTKALTDLADKTSTTRESHNTSRGQE
jgi:hypothetical protein